MENLTDINVKNNLRRGRIVERKQLKSVTRKVDTLREGSIVVNGPKLFNSMPKQIRAISGCSTEVFKRKLDLFLAHVVDAPPVYPANHKNSLVELLGILKISRGGATS